MKILIYGYGWVGKSMLEFLEDQNQEYGERKFDVFVYSDQFSPFIRDDRAIRKLEIGLEDVDIVFICVAKWEIAYKLYLDLVQSGISSEKIKYIDNYLYSCSVKPFLQYSINDFINMWKKDNFLNITFNQLIKVSSQHIGKIYYKAEYFNQMRHSLFDDRIEGEKKLAEYYKDYPVKFPVVGISYVLGRCGTTLMTQWLASLGIIEYATNFMQPYVDTPLVGFRNYMLFKKHFNIGFNSVEFESNFGSTRGMFNLLEFSWSELSGEEYKNHDFDFLETKVDYTRSLCAGFCDVAQKPFVFKASPQDVYIMEKALKKRAIYIVLKRDIYTHTLALVNLYRHFGFANNSLCYYAQFAGKEVSFDKEPILYAAITLKNAIAYQEKILNNVEESRKIKVSYEEFCNNPKALFEKIICCFKECGYDLGRCEYNGVSNFTISPRVVDVETKNIVDSVFNECE